MFLLKQYIDVTKEYINKTTKGIGNILYDEGYNIASHTDEIKVAILIHNIFGGNIRLINENNCSFGIKTSDYEWNGKLWELKILKSPNSIDSALRKGIEQIYINPGGVILYFENKIDSIKEVETKIKSRIETSCRFKIDILIMSMGKLEKVVRYN